MTETLPPQTQARQPGREHQMVPEPDYMPKYPGAGKLKGKVAIVSGGDSGIGRAVAVAFAREGASVVVLYLDEHEDARKTLRLVEDEGAEGMTIAGDIAEEEFAQRTVTETLKSV